MSQNFKTIDLQPKPEKPMGAHLRAGDSKDIISEQPSSRKMSMQAEPQVSMRGGGVIGDCVDAIVCFECCKGCCECCC